MLEAVVKSRKCENHQETEAIDAWANNTVEIVTLYWKRNENGNTDNAKQDTEPVHDAVHYFLFQSKLTGISLHKGESL